MEIHYSNSGGSGAQGPVGPAGPEWSPPLPQTWNYGLSAVGMNYSQEPCSGEYMQIGNLVSFWMVVDCSKITNLGTGQWHANLPVTPVSTATMAYHWEGGAYSGTTHVVLRLDNNASPSIMDFHFITAGPANQAIKEGLFSSTFPYELDGTWKMYINGTYLAVSGD